MMLSKAIVTFLVSLHLLPGPVPKPANPQQQAPSQQQQAPQKPNTTPTQKLPGNLSIPDEVYADLALQHELNHVSVYYFDDNPKNTVSIDSQKNWDPASTIKLFVAMYTFDQVAHAKISLDENIVINAKNIAPSESYANGYLPLNEGDNVTIFRLVDQMITQSDNTAYNTLLDILDRQQITKYIHDLGLTSSSIGAKLNLNDSQQEAEITTPGYGLNLITADDYAKGFILINGGRIPGSTDLFNILSRQKLNTMIPAYLPKGVTVAHKTGELDPFYHDGGIVIGPDKKYVLSVFSDMGDPGVVAHISDLIYTNDVNLVGSAQKAKTTGEGPLAPIDPLVAAGEPTSSGVLAANTQNIKVPKLTAADLGIGAKDISGALESKQLPFVLIPANSPLHFLVNLGEQIRVATNPIPSVRVSLQTENLKLSLAEANDLLAKGQKADANTILRNIDQNLTVIAKDQAVANNPTLQSAINQVSETRFSILGNELTPNTTSTDRINIIKEVANQAVNTTQNVKPFIADAVTTTDLSQAPLVGQVVKSTQSSITIQTPDGKQVTTPVDNQIKARGVGEDTSTVLNAAQIPVGSIIAIAGSGTDNQIKPSFILTNISPDLANNSPVTVLKVNQDTNSLVISSASGIPIQVDLNAQTIIKGTGTSVSLSQLKPGDMVIVHGTQLPATPSATLNASGSPLASPASGSNQGSGSSNNNGNTSNGTSGPTGSGSPTPNASGSAVPLGSPKGSLQPTTLPTASSKPSVTIAPGKTTIPATTAPKITPTTAPKVPVAPTVIKGSVIQVVQGTTKPSPAPSLPTKSIPNPIPPSTPPPATKH